MRIWVEYIGSLAAACTTLCWLPQALKIIREKQTQGISLITQAQFTVGLALWLIYGLLLMNWPLIISNAVTLVFSVVILILKVRYADRQA
jgi:MtN3 and saliva related transmembrane protein